MKVSKKQFQSWTAPNKASYISYRYGLPATLLGIILTLVFWAFPNDAIHRKSEPSNIVEQEKVSSSQRKDIFAMAQELRFNSDWIYKTILWHNDEGLKPVGSIKTEALMKVLSESYDEATKYSKGEQKYIYQIGLEINSLGQEISSADKSELAEFDQNSEYTLEDVYFLIEFMRWYTQYLVKENLGDNELYSLGWSPFPGKVHSPAFPAKAIYRKFDFDDDINKSFVGYLGGID